MRPNLYTPEQIESLYANIQGLKPTIEGIPDGEKLDMALWSALIATRAATAMSYGDDTVIPRCELPKGFNASANPWKVYSEVGVLLSDCISNGGRNYLPGKDRVVLIAVRKEIAGHVLDQLADGREVKG
jgi:hypothetical protein